MVYKNYTMSGSRKVPFAWRCPKCDILNIGAYQVKSSSSYDDRGFFVNLENRKQKAEGNLTQSLEKIAYDAVLDVENRRFDKVKLTAKCSGCGAVPPWADLPQMPPKALTTVRGIALAAAIVFLLIGFFSDGDKKQTLQICSVVAAAVFVLLLIAGWWMKRRMLADAMPAIEALPSGCRPRMAPTGPELLRRLKEDGVLTTEEAGKLGASETSYSKTLSEHYREDAGKRASSQRNKKILAAVLIAAALGIYGLVQYNGIQNSNWQALMESADLFTANANAGDRFIVHETPRSGKGSFSKNYLSADDRAVSPEEVGYIIVIQDQAIAVGTYKFGSATSGTAYRVDTSLRLFDCHTGA